MDKGYIYVIKNRINDKKYVRQTSRSIKYRWKEHLKDYQYKDYPLYKAMRKHGSENFWIEELEQCDLKNIDDKEKYWIATLNSFKKGYNCTKGRKNENLNQKYPKLRFKNNDVIFDSVEDFSRIFSEEYNFSVEYVRVKLHKAIRNEKKFYGFWPQYLKWESQASEKVLQLEFIKNIQIDNYTKQKIMCMETGQIFNSVRSAAQFYQQNQLYTGDSKNPIQCITVHISNALKTGKSCLCVQGYHFQYIQDKQEKYTPIKTPYINTPVKCLELNKTFKSQKEAAQYMVDQNLWETSLKTAKLRISEMVLKKITSYKNYSFVKI